ncbi:hypothetical protein BGZ76_010642 [Entomortierella beljakovae]|nr:hypothetical protein BGZ76_010642 [Entomortierella beljakovae]
MSPVVHKYPRAAHAEGQDPIPSGGVAEDEVADNMAQHVEPSLIMIPSVVVPDDNTAAENNAADIEAPMGEGNT